MPIGSLLYLVFNLILSFACSFGVARYSAKLATPDPSQQTLPPITRVLKVILGSTIVGSLIYLVAFLINQCFFTGTGLLRGGGDYGGIGAYLVIFMWFAGTIISLLSGLYILIVSPQFKYRLPVFAAFVNIPFLCFFLLTLITQS